MLYSFPYASRRIPTDERGHAVRGLNATQAYELAKSSQMMRIDTS